MTEKNNPLAEAKNREEDPKKAQNSNKKEGSKKGKSPLK
jgi:hypothetical protein